MVPTRQVDRVTHMADLLLKSQAALEEVHQYYKVGRHEGKAIEKPYFLLSHCANLLFSLWLMENESRGGLFKHSSYLSSLNADLNFGALRYTDYVRRTLHANALQEHVKNEPKWFHFWLKVLENQEGSRPVDYPQFSREILRFVSHPGFLEGKAPKKSRKPVVDLLKTDDAARIFQQSMTVLEESIRAVVCWLADLDQNRHASEQMASLICLLHQVRRIIIHETPAQGPYVLLSNKEWGIPSTLFRMYSGRMRGTLKVVPKRDGGSVVCAYAWASGAESKCRSWTRDISALTRPYEELLFQTWSYDTGQPLTPPEPSGNSKACWAVQDAEARRLQAIFQHIDTVLRALGTNPQCTGLAADVARVRMKNLTERRNTELAWTYVKELDKLLNKLKFASREAQVLGGKNPGAEVISNMWPPEPSVARPRAESNRTAVPSQPREAHGPGAPSPLDPGVSTDETCDERHRPQDRAIETEQALPAEPSGESRADTDSTQREVRTSISTPAPEESAPPIDRAGEPAETVEAVAESDGQDSEEPGSNRLLIIEEPEEFDSTPFLSTPTANDANPAPGETRSPTPVPTETVERITLSQTDRVTETNESAEVVAGINDEAVTEQNADEELAALEPKPQRKESVISSSTTDGTELGEKDSTVVDSAADATNTDPASETDRTIETQTSGEPTGGSTQQVATGEETVAVSGLAERETDRPEGPTMKSDQSLGEPQTNIRETSAEPTEQATLSLSGTPQPEERHTSNATSSADEPQAEVSAFALRQRLLQWHRPADKPVNYDAISLRRLQQDLGWKQSEVQRTMTEIFGRKPFTVYKEKCASHTVCDLLEGSVGTHGETQEGTRDASRSSTVTAIATSDRLFCEYVSRPRSNTGTSESTGSRRAAKQVNETDLAAMDRQLLDRLLEHHLGLNGRMCDDPLSFRQLQQDLTWKASEVQRSMTRLFGSKPFTTYKSSCDAGTIGDFLEAGESRCRDEAEQQQPEMVDQHAAQTV